MPHRQRLKHFVIDFKTIATNRSDVIAHIGITSHKISTIVKHYFFRLSLGIPVDGRTILHARVNGEFYFPIRFPPVIVSVVPTVSDFIRVRTRLFVGTWKIAMLRRQGTYTLNEYI